MKPQEFVKSVVSQYNKGKGIFKHKINAEELIPHELNGLNKSLYIFYVLQLDYAMKSQILYKGANQLYETNKKFFTTSNLTKITEQELGGYLKKYLHPRYINEAIRRYRINTQTLINNYDGDPRKIFASTLLCSPVLKRLKLFRGFGPKIGNFFVRTMINTFDYKFTDIETIMPPVDVHDVKIAYLLGYTDSNKMTAKNIEKVKKTWNRACLESGESWLVFDKALWLLGSEGKPKNEVDIFKLLNV